MSSRLIIIDGHAILHRAYHALPPLTTSKGELVNAVYGFCSMILRVRDELKPACFAVTFDLPQPTFRKKLFADYQAKRPQMDKELSGQIEKVKELVKTLKIPIYEKAGFEADDVIGTLAKQATEAGSSLEVIIVTGDRDLLQLVNKNTKVYMLLKGLTEATLFDEAGVEGKYGLKSKQIPDYKALIGDASDNYPGVSGIGPKSAVRLLKSLGTLKEIYNHLKKVEPGLREKLEKGKEAAELSFKLATIKKDVPVKIDLKKCEIGEFTQPEVIRLLEELEFKSLIPRLAGKLPEETKPPAKAEKQSQDDGQIGLF